MESPFFRSHWSNYKPPPRYAPSFKDVPVQRPAARPSPRVVSIPVHFVGSDRSRSDSALKIQKVFRGFLVRKSVKKIAEVKREVDKVEKKMSRRETVEAIRSDAKERLRLNETLMSSLLRLDSVRGVDYGVRDCRKAVIKKAIALQERIDAIVAGDQATGAGDESSEEVGNVESVSEVEDQAQQTRDLGELQKGGDDDAAELEHTESEVDQSPEFCVEPPNPTEIESVQALEKEDKATLSTDEPMPTSNDTKEGKDEDEALQPQASALTDVEEKAEPETAMADAVETAMEEVEEPESAVEAIENEEALEESAETGNDTESESRSSSAKENGMEVAQAKKKEEEEEEEEEGTVKSRRRSKELMERMVEDNEKLMGLMAELYEKNAMQTRLLSSLSQRVEQLERAFVCEKLRKKKKQRRECCGRSADANNKNSGNRL